jgi:deoxyinosine 3'endonuclease (endonuclease V)
LAEGGARAAMELVSDATFSRITAEETALVPEVAPYRPGEFFRRELPPLRAVPSATSRYSCGGGMPPRRYAAEA